MIISAHRNGRPWGSRSRGEWAAIAATNVDAHASDDRRTIIALCCILLETLQTPHMIRMKAERLLKV
jgi:hypothetical protein